MEAKMKEMHEKIMKLIDEKSDLQVENYELKKRVDTLLTVKPSTDFMMSKNVMDLKSQIDKEIEIMKKDEAKTSERIIKLELEKKRTMMSNSSD